MSNMLVCLTFVVQLPLIFSLFFVVVVVVVVVVTGTQNNDLLEVYCLVRLN
jgi:hypothetical protein